MNCPLCLDTVLEVTYHAGIELDICPKCRGVWLDRGELNRIVDELEARPGGRSMERRDDRPGSGRPDRPPARDPDYERSAGRGPGQHKTRKRSFASRLGDVFEEIVDL